MHIQTANLSQVQQMLSSVSPPLFYRLCLDTSTAPASYIYTYIMFAYPNLYPLSQVQQMLSSVSPPPLFYRLCLDTSTVSALYIYMYNVCISKPLATGSP